MANTLQLSYKRINCDGEESLYSGPIIRGGVHERNRGEFLAVIGRGRKDEEAKEESRCECIDPSSSAPRPFSNFRSAGILCKLPSLSLPRIWLDRRKAAGRDGGSDGRIPKGSMSSIDLIGGRFVFNGCFRMARRHLNWNPEAPYTPRTPLFCLGWPILLLPIFRSVARACEKQPRVSIVEPFHVARRLRAQRCLCFYIPHALFYNSHLSSLLPSSPFHHYLTFPTAL